MSGLERNRSSSPETSAKCSKDFEAGEQVDALVRIGFEAAREEIFGVLVAQGKVEAAIAHHADENAVAAAEIGHFD